MSATPHESERTVAAALLWVCRESTRAELPGLCQQIFALGLPAFDDVQCRAIFSAVQKYVKRTRAHSAPWQEIADAAGLDTDVLENFCWENCSSLSLADAAITALRERRKLREAEHAAHDLAQAARDGDAAAVHVNAAVIQRMTAPDAGAPRPSRMIKELITLPGGDVSISDSAQALFEIIAPTKQLFHRGGRVMELRPDGEKVCLDVVLPDAFRSRIEKFGSLVVWRKGADGEEVMKPTVCPKETAQALLATAEARDLLPHVQGLTDSPIITEVDGEFKVLGKGWHPVHGGLLVTSGTIPPVVPLAEARSAILVMLEEFNFQTPSDLSRAVASLLTPAMRIGGLVKGGVPIDDAEADGAGAGKGFRQSLIFATYNAKPGVVARKDGGVGGTDESLMEAMVRGQWAIQLDNVRGKIDSQFLEATLTAEGSIGCRIPGVGTIQVHAPHFMFFITSNGIETTRDLASRSSIIRILRRDNFAFRAYAEGSILDHVKAHQSYYLGCIIAIIREWHRRGKPKTSEVRHRFREWAQPLDWIVQNIFQLEPLLDGHDSALSRVSNPALSWLRLVAIAVQKSARLGEEFQVGALADFCDEHSIEIPRLAAATDEARRKKIGVLMGQVFGDGDATSVDNFAIARRSVERHDEEYRGFRTVRSYIFSAARREKLRSCAPCAQAILVEEKQGVFQRAVDPCAQGAQNVGMEGSTGEHGSQSPVVEVLL